MLIGNSIPLEVAPPTDLAVGSPARSEILLHRVASPASVASSGLPPSSSVLCPAPDVDPSSGLAANLSLEGPFDVHQDRPVSGASPRVLDGMRGCQCRMTSCDQESGGPDSSPAYGVQLHDPRLLEYVGAPESAWLLSRSPEYWLHHLGHEKTLAAALQLQHDAGLILSNVQFSSNS